MTDAPNFCTVWTMEPSRNKGRIVYRCFCQQLSDDQAYEELVEVLEGVYDGERTGALNGPEGTHLDFMTVRQIPIVVVFDNWDILYFQPDHKEDNDALRVLASDLLRTLNMRLTEAGSGDE